ncbi:hypothetical protein LUZ60_005483 [Juncus effusus]|nr:hypothetical protein LUZ60_005483 [Juncus effusus]
MGKGRKYSSDRLLTTSASSGQLTGSLDLPDLEESDVWSTLEPDHEPITGRNMGGLSRTFNSSYSTTNPNRPTGRRHVSSVASSAPVNVPDWSALIRVGSNQSGHKPVYYGQMERDDDDGEWVPPHQWAQTRSGSGSRASVFEGVGRTLKGRDMSRVRDAVWSQTGFDG